MSSQPAVATDFKERFRPVDLRRRPDIALAAIAIAVLVFGAVTTTGFLTSSNFKAILASVGILGIVAVGMTCITLSGNSFSLSLGVTVTVASLAFLSWLHLGIVPALVLTIALTTAICGAQGVIVAFFGANPIIATIGFGALQIGAASNFTNGSVIYPSGGGFDWLASSIAGLPFSVFVLAGLVIVLDLWLRNSRDGQEIYLAGENRDAARAGALRVERATVLAFSIAGACAGIGGILLAAVNKNANLIGGGDLYSFDAIAVVLVGGVAVTGGRGSVVRTVFGALFIAALTDMLLLRGYSNGIQTLVVGVAVLLAIVGMQLRRMVAR